MPPNRSERFELRLEPALLESVDEWRAAEADLPTRAEAIRRLTTIGLETRTTRQAFMAIKFQILVAALTKGPGEKLDEAYVFAWDRDIYPWFHDGASWHKPFKGDFEISHDMMRELMVYLDEKWLAGTAIPTFYELESTFGVRDRDGHWDRGSLIGACRYAYLSNRFDQKLWRRLLEPTEYPIEASGIADPFDRKQSIYLM